jgi:HD superfamily phosphohydrolase
MFEEPNYLPLLIDVVQTPAFQRLRDIRFLGAIDYLIVPSGSIKRKRHTRYEHSLSVAKLAQEYAHQRRLGISDEKHLVIAALLHDIGHGPLSHSLEPALKERFGITHHEATELILKGTVPIGVSLPRIFAKYKLDRSEVIALIAGTSNTSYAEALKSPVNVDTIEAITRAYTYLAPKTMLVSAQRVLAASIDRTDRDISVLDEFWGLKDLVYDQLIGNRLSVIADFVSRDYVQRTRRFWSGDYFISETALRKEHPHLFQLLNQLRTHKTKILNGEAISVDYQKRRFTVDHSVKVTDSTSLYSRYRQDKSQSRLRFGDEWRQKVTPQLVRREKNERSDH